MIDLVWLKRSRGAWAQERRKKRKGALDVSINWIRAAWVMLAKYRRTLSRSEAAVCKITVRCCSLVLLLLCLWHSLAFCGGYGYSIWDLMSFTLVEVEIREGASSEVGEWVDLDLSSWESAFYLKTGRGGQILTNTSNFFVPSTRLLPFSSCNRWLPLFQTMYAGRSRRVHKQTDQTLTGSEKEGE